MREIHHTYWRVFSIMAFFALSANVFGQVYDPFSNEEIITVTRSEEVKPTQDFIRNSFDISYLEIKEPRNKTEVKINESILPLCRKYADDETEYLRLLAELKSRKIVYNSIQQSKNDYGGSRYDEIPGTSIPELSRIECRPVTLVANKLFFSVEINFRVGPPSRYESLSISITHYYTADLQTGKIERRKISYPQQTLDKLMQVLSTPLNDQYKLVTSKLKTSDIYKMEAYDEETGEPIDTAACEDICPRILLEDADFIWFGSGLKIYFPEYCESSKIYDGRGFQIFLPFVKAKQLVKLLPDFQFANGLNPKPTDFRNYNYFDNFNNFQIANRPPEIERVIETAKDKTVKNLIINSYQVHETGEKTFRRKQNYTFNKDNLKTEYETYNDRDELYATTYYTYSSDLNLLKELQINARDESEVLTAYTYDKYGNILQRIKSEPQDFQIAHLFYNGAFMYTFGEDVFGGESGHVRRRVEWRDGVAKPGRQNYKMDDSGNILGLKSSPRMSNQFQIGYNENGKITEIHQDLDRYQTYIYYDDQDRLVEWVKLDGTEVTNKVEFSYKIAATLPSQRLQRSGHEGETVILDVYEWEFFED